MSVTTDPLLSLTPGLSDCLDVFTLKQQDTWSKDWMSMGIAFAVAFVVGGLIAAFCSRCCFKDILKSKREKARHAESGHSEDHHIVVADKQQLMETQSGLPPGGRGGRRKRTKPARKKGSAVQDEQLMPISPVILEGEENLGGQGLLDALVKGSGADMEMELANQDLDALSRLEKEFREQNIDTMMQLLRTLLNKHLKKGKISEEQSQELMRNAQENLNSAIKQCQRERDAEEQEIKRKTKDPKKLESELDQLNTKYNNKLGSMVQGEKERFRQDLGKTTDLSDVDIDALMAELTRNMATLEHTLGVERLRQAEALEERLAKRRQLAELQRGDTEARQMALCRRKAAHDAGLSTLVTDGKLQERQKDAILAQYSSDLERIQAKHNEDYQRQQQTLAEKLRIRRQKEMDKLRTVHDGQKDDFIKSTDQSLDTDDLVQAYNELLQQQRAEEDDVIDRLDDIEADEIRKLARSSEKECNVDIQQLEETFEESLRAKSQLSEGDVDRLIALHQRQMEEYDDQKKVERRRMKAAMEEKLQQRRLRVQVDHQLALAETTALKEQQDATIDKVLQSQVELAPGDKEKILQEHEQNMTSVNNQLQMSRLRQQKQLEAKLNARRARVDDMQHEMERSKLAKKKETEKHVATLEKQIADEERRMSEERRTATAALRERLAAETTTALGEQERQLGLLIARLQVGQARRQALIGRQDKTIRELEEKLADRIDADGRGSRADRDVEQLLQTHMNQVSTLTGQLQDVKERQNNILQEKLEQKRLRKERDIEDKLEQDVQTEFQVKKRQGTAGLATALLSQSMLDSRHKMALAALEQEMEAEMKAQREQLNDELENDLQAELESQKKSFLSQLAAISNISRDEVSELVESAVADTGGDVSQAKQLSKDMRVGLKQAKTDLGIDDRDTPAPKKGKKKNPGYQNGGYDDRYEDEGYSRPKSATRSRDDYNDYDY